MLMEFIWLILIIVTMLGERPTPELKRSHLLLRRAIARWGKAVLRGEQHGLLRRKLVNGHRVR